jgi:3-oxoacyl-[acyl-carrier-protein] synthase-1
MAAVYVGAENIITSLGFDAQENYINILKGISGIEIDKSHRFSPDEVPLSLVDRQQLEISFNEDYKNKYTSLELMFILSIQDVLRKSKVDISSPDSLFVFTSTKGNIVLLNPDIHPSISRDRTSLMRMAEMISSHFNNSAKPVVISNACVSGVVGLLYAARLVESGKYKNIIVSGGDQVSEFIVSGFQSFQSLSSKPCKPFDKSRDGLTLGEGVGSILVSSDPEIFKDEAPLRFLGGSSSNDANHISGPSRTGAGLQVAIRHALATSEIMPEELHMISAHGTATDYNDEMEAKAFSGTGLDSIPTNSFKGYIGHTLGAAGVIETAILLQAMRDNMLIRSAGYETHGLTKNINIIRETKHSTLNTCLKTGSGFGGSNAALILQKHIS